jgi:hypothetical protein
MTADARPDEVAADEVADKVVDDESAGMSPVTPPGAAAGATPAASAAAPAIGDDVATVLDGAGELAPPVTPSAPADAGPAVVDAGAPVPATAEPSTRRVAARAGVLWLMRMALSIGLFAIGIGIGLAYFQRLQPPPVVPADISTGSATPAVVQELVTALGSNDPDAMRSAVPPDPYAQLVGEMVRRDFKEITRVETLTTVTDGYRTATEVILFGNTTTNLPVLVNLVVQTQSGQIVMLR